MLKNNEQLARKVLVIDDEEELRFALKELLEVHGWQVAVSANGFEALEQTKKQHFDIIISDIRMPKCNGLEFLEKLDTEYKKKTSIIMISAYSDYDQEQLVNLGAKRLLSKPINGASLMQNMLDVLNNKNSL